MISEKRWESSISDFSFTIWPAGPAFGRLFAYFAVQMAVFRPCSVLRPLPSVLRPLCTLCALWWESWLVVGSQLGIGVNLRSSAVPTSVLLPAQKRACLHERRHGTRRLRCFCHSRFGLVSRTTRGNRLPSKVELSCFGLPAPGAGLRKRNPSESPRNTLHAKPGRTPRTIINSQLSIVNARATGERRWTKLRWQT